MGSVEKSILSASAILLRFDSGSTSKPFAPSILFDKYATSRPITPHPMTIMLSPILGFPSQVALIAVSMLGAKMARSGGSNEGNSMTDVDGMTKKS